MNGERDVMVHLESIGESREEINKGLLSEGARIAELLGGALHAVIVGNASLSLSTLDDFGTTGLYRINGSGLDEYRHEVYAWAIGAFLKTTASPKLLLFAQSDMGMDLAPEIAALMKSAAVTDISDIKVRDGKLSYVKPCYGDNFEQEISYRGGLLEVAAVRPVEAIKPKLLKKVELKAVDVSIEVPPEMVRTKHLGLIDPDFRTVDIIHAAKIVGVGMGCNDKELLPVIRELAEMLEGALGTTRPVVDEGHIPKDRMIGMTGKSVAPDFYLALGISGSPHHVAGLQKAKKIVSVNKDPGAAIFQASDVGYVADLKKMIPRLHTRIKEWRGE